MSEGDEVQREEIAVVGMSGRFPGATDIHQLWENLRAGISSIREFTDDELTEAGVAGATREDPSWVNAGAFLAEPDGFDAELFGMSPREARLTDPQHRIFLECVWEALEHAGHDPERFEGLISLFGGVAANTYLRHMAERDEAMIREAGDYPLLLASEREYAVTRAAFKLGLRGPAVHVGTACSTSAVAIHLAAQSLLAGESDLSVAGGVRIRVPMCGYLYEEGGILSPDGFCRAFDVDARGTVAASGAAFVVLRRLADAVDDGDTVYALLKGSAINNDGADKAGFTAPSARGQSQAVLQALSMAEVDARTIDYVEAHGTGTELGDPIEIAGLTRAFRHDTRDVAYCRIGSLKTNIGHLDAAAGAAGVIKTIMAMRAGEIPPSLNFREPNPQLALETSPFLVNDSLHVWAASPGRPRRAGVSSFGLGGTNAHLILEEWPQAETDGGLGRVPEVILLSARTAEALERSSAAVGEFLEQRPELPLADVAHTLRVGRRRMLFRRAVVARSTESAAAALRQPSVGAASPRPAMDSPRVALLLPGGGSQHVDMARGLYDDDWAFRDSLDECAQILKAVSGEDIRSMMFPPDAARSEAAKRMRDVRWGLPALFAVEYAMARWWIDRGLRPQGLIGHSLGEYVAACLAGVLSLPDALGLVDTRSRLMQNAPKGAMLSVALGEQQALDHVSSDVSLAAVNTPDSCVLSGPVDAIEDVEQRLRSQAIDASRVRIDVASHSHLMDAVSDQLVARAREVSLSPPSIPVVSNVTGTWLTDQDAIDPDYWGRHLSRTVRFADGVAVLASVADVAVEAGPSTTLSGYWRVIQGSSPAPAIASMRHPQDERPDLDVLLEAAGSLWVHGVDVIVATPERERVGRRVGLPTYPFEHQRFWLDPVSTNATETDNENHLPTNSTAAPPSATQAARVDRIADRVLEILAQLSGLERAALDLTTPFADLGFDSLFLTQANTAFRKEFDVRITFRQLFEQAPDVSSLAAFIDDKLPAEAAEERVAFDASAMASPDDASSPPPVSLEDRTRSGTLERIVTEQLRVMALQVEALSDVAGTMPDLSTSQGSPEQAKPRPAQEPAQQQLSKEQGIHQGEPDERARKAIDELVRGYGTRTRRSRELADSWRPQLADNRTIVGFDRAWKDLVYQIVAERSSGARIWDVDGNELVDTALGFGSVLLGHAHPAVVAAIDSQLRRSFAVGVQSDLLGEVTARILGVVGKQRLTYCHSGGEAVETAIRIARTVTARDKVVYFTDDVHGRADIVLGRGVGTGLAARTVPLVAGVPQHVVEDAFVLEYGSPEAMDVISAHGEQIAAVLVEPVRTRNPDLQPLDFLQQLRQAADRERFLVIYDEIVTGFRVHARGVQGLWNLKADLTTYGKVLGGGMPIGVVAGDAELIDVIDGGPWRSGDASYPTADITGSGGTMIKHPVSLAAARAVLDVLDEGGPTLQADLTNRTTELANGLNEHFERHGIPVHVQQFGSFFRPTFTENRRYEGLFQYFLRERGVHTNPPSPSFLSTAHGPAELELVSRAYREAATQMAEAGMLDHGIGTRKPVETEELADPIPSQERPLPLLPNAHRFLVERQSADVHHWNVGGLLEATSPLDPDALAAATDHVIRRHDALRLRYRRDREGGWSAFIVGPEPQAPFDALDLSQLSSGEQDHVMATANNEVQASFNLETGPVCWVRLIDLGSRGQRLLVVMHHLVMDGLSWRPFWQDFLAAYAQSSAGSPVVFSSSSSSFAEWSTALERYVGSAEASARGRQWRELPWHDVRRLPVDHLRDDGSNTNASARVTSLELSAEETDALLHRTPSVRRKVDLLITALSEALAEWIGSETVLVDMMGHGRDEELVEDVDLFDTLGFFISYTPMVLSVAPEDSAARVLTQQIHSALRDGASFDLLRTMSPDAEMRATLEAMPRAEVLFNYLGKRSRLDTVPDQPEPLLLTEAAEPPGGTHNPRGLRYYPLSVSAEVWNGQLRMVFVYSENLHDEETVESLTARVGSLLRELVDASSVAPV